MKLSVIHLVCSDTTEEFSQKVYQYFGTWHAALRTCVEADLEQLKSEPVTVENLGRLQLHTAGLLLILANYACGEAVPAENIRIQLEPKLVWDVKQRIGELEKSKKRRLCVFLDEFQSLTGSDSASAEERARKVRFTRNVFLAMGCAVVVSGTTLSLGNFVTAARASAGDQYRAVWCVFATKFPSFAPSIKRQLQDAARSTLKPEVVELLGLSEQQEKKKPRQSSVVERPRNLIWLREILAEYGPELKKKNATAQLQLITDKLASVFFETKWTLHRGAGIFSQYCFAQAAYHHWGTVERPKNPLAAVGHHYADIAWHTIWQPHRPLPVSGFVNVLQKGLHSVELNGLSVYSHLTQVLSSIGHYHD